MTILQTIKTWAQKVERDAVTLWFAYRHPATPWPVKALCAFVVAYALSPIDLIPDFIPVFGYLDDAILLPGLIWLAIRLLPFGVLAESHQRAYEWMESEGKKPSSYIGAVAVVAIWLAMSYAAYWYWLR